MINTKNLKVKIVDTWKAALEEAAVSQISLVVASVEPEFLSSFENLIRLRKLQPESRIVLMNSEIDNGDMRKFEELNITESFEKPLDSKKIKAVVREAAALNR